MRTLTWTAATLFLALTSCGAGGGQEPVVLGEAPARRAPTPSHFAVVGGVTMYGGAGGQAPHAVHVRGNVDAPVWVVDKSYRVGDRVKIGGNQGIIVYACSRSHKSTLARQPGSGGSASNYWSVYSTPGSGWWPEGRWQFQFCKADGSRLDTADRDWMRVTDPISKALVYTDDRYGAAPNAAFVFRSPGSYKARVRYQNRDKDWSEWVESSTITVASNTRAKRYVNGSTGHDSNDGTSSGQAKATLNAALSLVTGDDFEIEIADGTSCDVAAVVDTSAHSGLYIHRSGEGVAPTVVLKAEPSIIIGSRCVVDGLNLGYDGVDTYSAFSLGVANESVTLANITINKASALAEISNAALPAGLLFFNCRTLAKLDRYTVFVHDVTCLSIIGCSFDFGSLNEHTVRVSSGNGGSTGTGYSRFVSIDFTTLDHDAEGKSSFRCYARHVGVSRTILANGAVSIGDQDKDTQSFEDYCYDGCVFNWSVGGTSEIQIYSNATRVVIRSSYIDKNTHYRAGPIIVLTDGALGERACGGVRLLNLSVSNTGSGNDSYSLWQQSTLPFTDVLVRGCLWWLDDTEVTYQRPIFLGTGSGRADGWTFEDCVFPTLTDQAVFQVGGANYTVAEVDLETWADGLITEDHAFDNDGEPLGAGASWKTAVRSSRGVFESLNEQDMATAGPAGCWKEP